MNTNAQGKIRDGECTFFLWASFESPEARLLAASAFEDYTSAISEAAVAGGKPSQPLPDLRGDVLAGTTLVEVEVLAMNLAVLVFGRADIHDGHAHEPGYVDVSGVDPKLTAGGMTGRLRLEPAPQATRAVFDHAATAMAAYLRSPDIEVLSAAMDGLSAVAPGFRGHGNCQTPHPVANHHAFEYRDAFDCVAREIAHMVGPIERRLDGIRR